MRNSIAGMILMALLSLLLSQQGQAGGRKQSPDRQIDRNQNMTIPMAHSIV